MTLAGSIDEELRAQLAVAVGEEGERRFASGTSELAATLAGVEGPRMVVLRLAALGVDSVALQGYNDPRPMVRDALRGSGLALVARDAWRAIERVVPADLCAFFQYTLARAGSGITVAEVAAGLGVHPRTLGNRLRRAGLPSSERAIGWCRLLVAARVLDQTDAPIERVAVVGGMGPSSLPCSGWGSPGCYGWSRAAGGTS
ncbi:MAG TPA: hypothetical protein VF041_04645 [Gemmatimonadaceae bacterium]